MNLAGSLVYTSPESTTDDFDEHGRIAPAQGHAIGSLVLQMVYDGVGRLIQVRRPVPLGQATSPPRPLFQIEDYYYDGVRRIQEVVATETGIGTLTLSHTEREYIYGPEYVDEFIAQIDDPASAQPTTMYVLQDANYNVSALLSAPANPQTQAPAVLAEYTYDPYGQPVYAFEPGLTPTTRNTVGHQGLFFYRLDFKTNGQGNTLAPLHPTTTGLYYNRNRWYSPKLGRFMQRDPNGTSLAILASIAKGGRAIERSVRSFLPEDHYLEGFNLHQYLSGNPIGSTDPGGLFSYMELAGVTAFGVEMDANTMDMGMSLVGAIRGMVDLINNRNMMLSAIAGLPASPIDTSDLDMAIAGYQTFQQAQAALLAAGVLKAGAKFAYEGFKAVLRKARGHHGIAKYLGGNPLQFLYQPKNKKFHHKFEQKLLARLKAAGFPDSNIGSSGYWKWLEKSGRQGEAFRIVSEVASECDSMHGTDFFLSFQLNVDLGLFTEY